MGVLWLQCYCAVGVQHVGFTQVGLLCVGALKVEKVEGSRLILQVPRSQLTGLWRGHCSWISSSRWRLESHICTFCIILSLGCVSFIDYVGMGNHLCDYWNAVLVLSAALWCLCSGGLLPWWNINLIRSPWCYATNHYPSTFCSSKIWITAWLCLLGLLSALAND